MMDDFSMGILIEAYGYCRHSAKLWDPDLLGLDIPRTVKYREDKAKAAAFLQVAELIEHECELYGIELPKEKSKDDKS